MGKINFKTLGAKTPKPAQSITEPRDLFSALPEKDSTLDYLRGPQDQVLAAWHARRDERDVVIKMNTGGGKTLVGLLIARSLLNEGVSPTAYSSPMSSSFPKSVKRPIVWVSNAPSSPRREVISAAERSSLGRSPSSLTDSRSSESAAVFPSHASSR